MHAKERQAGYRYADASRPRELELLTQIEPGGTTYGLPPRASAWSGVDQGQRLEI